MSFLRAATVSALVLLLCLLHGAPAYGSGPAVFTPPPNWNFTISECAIFRNETVLRPLFTLWPESIKNVRFRYCCEYQTTDYALIPCGGISFSSFKLSTYRYSPDEGNLVPAPYYDLGLIDKKYSWYWQHWAFWRLPRLPTPSLYCEVTDLHRLYMHRFWRGAILRGAITAATLVGILLIGGIGIPFCRSDPDVNRESYYSRYTRFKWQWNKVQWEELCSDLLHVVLLSLVGTCLMEGVGHSSIREWRSQLMYNGGVVYTYLTLFAILSALFRHSVNPKKKHKTDWRWQKVFGQFAAQFTVGAYLGLVEDVSGHGLDGVACLVLGTAVGATIWSAGVELYIILQIFHFKPEK
ncbi:hypothetical protein KC19_3G164200 [Ceratodon purpureus]|uniref:Uncharacterized protein n=1 Tax=Ceratodon purpureus TaxID=3225 RepID=A0A8T0IJ68_CERPU|nr:hypothetical protein KC19_3G164200 [Ceratodon purpureus]